jgi:PKD repeat protein
MSHKVFHCFASLILALAISFAGFTSGLTAPPTNGNLAQADEPSPTPTPIPPPINDNFTNATVILTLPFGYSVDTFMAGKESGEPQPSCASNEFGKTVWYSYTPTTSGSITASIPWASFAPLLVVYTGNSLTSLNELGCSLGNNLIFHVDAGVTYYFQVGANWNDGGPVTFYLDVTPPPSVWFWYNPFDPSVFDTIQFGQMWYDPANIGIQLFAWDFGDGVTSTDWSPIHKYSADGDYTVYLTATTFDGRTASATQVVSVKTHDVAITKISAPQSASSGQTRSITVFVNNKRYDEYVRVDLYRSIPGGFEWIGAYTQFVPVRSANRTTSFTFNYTFTKSDASIGKVSFKAEATIIDARDAWFADNDLTSSPPTKVFR